MARDDTTTTQHRAEAAPAESVPGLAVVFEKGKATFRVTPVGSSGLTLGRGTAAGYFIDDDSLSRVHCAVGMTPDVWRIEDKSRHGTFVDGQRISGLVVAESPRVLRIGESVLVFEPDVTCLLGQAIELRDEMILGPRIRGVEREIIAAALSESDLLVHGESGTGKEWAAARFHAATGRTKAQVPVNCAALAEGLFESEVFGYMKGAFSGADRDRPGLFESAHGGTLFLDEIGELPLDLQPKLLRVLQERSVRRVGDARERSIDVRVIAATNRLLENEIAKGRFRADLYWRLAQTSVRLPPLRERAEDLPHLVEVALKRAHTTNLSAALIEEVLLRDWEGNVRELTIACARAARAAIEAKAASVDARHLPPRPEARTQAIADEVAEDTVLRRRLTSKQVIGALQARKGNVSLAATDLGVHRNTLHRYIVRYGIRVE
jgi:transcriptional regulator with GAF, ATPase, and Fis domain